MLMAKWVLVSIIFAVLLIELAVGQSQQRANTIGSSDKPEYQTSDIYQDFEPIEYAVSTEKTPGNGTVITKSISKATIYLSLGVLAFGLALILFTGFVALKKNSGWDQEATRIFAVSVIVTAGLFLITAGYSDQQIAPMFGLLGTIVGYLLGKSPPGEQSSKS